MYRRGQLAPPTTFLSKRFLFVFPSSAGVDADLFVRNYSWEFWILEKAFQRAPSLQCFIRGSMSDLIEGFGDTGCVGKVQPFSRPFSFDCRELAKVIPPLCEFRLKFVGNPITPSDPLDFYAIIDGDGDYAVQ